VAPVITGLPSSADITETESTEYLLHAIDVTDADAGDFVTCQLGVTTTPNNGENDFRMKYDSTTSSK